MTVELAPHSFRAYMYSYFLAYGEERSGQYVSVLTPLMGGRELIPGGLSMGMHIALDRAKREAPPARPSDFTVRSNWYTISVRTPAPDSVFTTRFPSEEVADLLSPHVDVLLATLVASQWQDAVEKQSSEILSFMGSVSPPRIDVTAYLSYLTANNRYIWAADTPLPL